MKRGNEEGNGRTVVAGRTEPLTWKDLCLDSRFQDLPYKIELNGRGQIIMSPTRIRDGFYAFNIGHLIEQHLPDGEVIIECAVDTADGTKEADAAWVSRNRWAVIQAEYSSSIAPEICAEVMSRSTTRQEMMQKKDLYLGAGAREYWLCHEDGKLEFFDSTGELQESKMCPKFPKAIRKM
ncbi:MAG TPA: Uma2 family endonuclease [Verrucomicrobiae bacterium]|nr:Uma2 family endonuclease [Verrucomicrobiae bacterium]